MAETSISEASVSETSMAEASVSETSVAKTSMTKASVSVSSVEGVGLGLSLGHMNHAARVGNIATSARVQATDGR